jgi:hypothetical protein
MELDERREEDGAERSKQGKERVSDEHVNIWMSR